MTTSATMMPSTFSLNSDEKVPDYELAYFEQRALNNFYSYVMRKFRASGRKKADVARRIGLTQPQLNRYLASPSNWTIETSQKLLLGIANEEAFLRGESLLNKRPQNKTVLDLLDEEKKPKHIRIGEEPITGSNSTTTIWSP